MIRKARPEDAEQIAQVLVRSIREACILDHNNDEAILADWCANKTPEHMRQGIAHPGHWIVAEENGAIVGTALISLEGNIMLCYLLPEHIGRGLGKAMLIELLRFAKEKGLAKVTLESTATARSFYKHNGFVEIAETISFGGFPSYQMECVL